LNAGHLHLHSYNLRLRPGVRLGYAELEKRSGVIVALTSGEPAHTGYGEAAPAWWVGDEPVATARQAIADAGDWFAAKRPDPADLDATLRANESLPTALAKALAPSRAATAALATALADHQARVSGQSLAEYLGGVLGPCATNALVVADDAGGIAADVGRAIAADYRTVKLKVGNYPPDTDIARIRAAYEAGRGRVRLRLDANRAWNLATATKVLTGFTENEIEYVEEPLADPTPDSLAALRSRCTVAFALDESINRDDDIDRFADSCEVIVAKPCRSNGPWSLLATARQAKALGLDVTLTDSLESAVGRATCLHLALAIGNADRATGLAGAALLAEDLTINSQALRGAVIEPTGPGLFPAQALRPELRG
jgi:o-succinylbenzoate synthase